MAGLELDSSKAPIFIGAGIIRTEEQIKYFAQEEVLQAQIIGSFSETEWGGSDPSGEKRVFWWDAKNQAAYNAIQLKNPGRKAASEYLLRSIELVKDMGQVAIVGVTSLKHEDPVEVIPDLVEWALDQGADGVEINGSCPNEGLHSVLCEDTDRTGEMVEVTRDKVGRDPFLLLKVSALERAAITEYKRRKIAVDAIDAINNCRRLSPINPQTNKPIIDVNNGFAGQSGPIIRDLARDNLAMWLEGDASYPVWSIGGVDSGDEVFHRSQVMEATMVGGAQTFYRSPDPRLEIQLWAGLYRALMEESSES